MKEENETIEEKVLRLSSTGAGVESIDNIYISPDRMRKDDAAVRRYIDEELAPSFLEHGIIQPPKLHYFTTPRQINGRYFTCELIAGWCRLQTALSLGLSQIPYVRSDELREDVALEQELEENLSRREMTWQDTALGIARIHDLKQKKAWAKGEKWGQKQTGKLLGYSHGRVSDCLKISKALEDGDEDICEAPNFTTAIKILLGRKEDEIIASLAEAAAPKSPETHVSEIGPIKGEAGIRLSNIASGATNPEPFKQEKKLVDSLDIDLGAMLFNDDNRDWFRNREDESVDMIYTDIPYGINMENLAFQDDDLDRVADAHDVDENISQMQPFLQNAYRVLKDKCYLMFWYDLAHHEKLQQWAKDAGFTVQVPPVVWCKEHPCKNRAGNVWITGATEYVMICRKGTGTLRQAITKNYILADGRAERSTQRNPFSKPFAVSKILIDAVTIPGDTVLDCYAGEGSLVRCALNMGRKILAVEKEKHHFDRLTEHVKKVFTSMTQGKARFS